MIPGGRCAAAWHVLTSSLQSCILRPPGGSRRYYTEQTVSIESDGTESLRSKILGLESLSERNTKMGKAVTPCI